MPDRDLVRRARPLQPATSPSGINYLLAIAINDYLHCTKLNNAVLDAEAFIDLMTSRYNFETSNVTFIKDTEATKKRIEQEFFRLIKTITPHDNLIVYFSGHGRHDEHFGGNWVPVDAGTTDDDWPDYLSNDTIKSYLSKIKSFHTFLIADSCFSGSLFIDKSKEKFSGDRRDTESSRWGLTSGKKEIVSDGRPGHHSPFAAALLDVLRKADQPPGVMRICDLVLEKVAANAEQTPMGSPLQVQGHQGGQMVFYFREDEEREWLQLSSSAEGCRTYLTRFPEGRYRALAEEVVAKDQAEKAWQQAKAAGVKYALLDFERDFPNSTPVLSGELNRILASMEEEELWLEATQSNTVSAYRMYLIRSVQKKHAQEATEAIKAISEKDREPMAWRQAKQLNTVTAFEAYLRDYPQGIYAAEADRELKQLLGKIVKDQPVAPSKEQSVILDQVLSTPAATNVQPNEKEPDSNSKLRWVVLSIIGFVLVLIVGNMVGLFSTQTDKEILAKLSSSMVLIPEGEFQMGSNSGYANEEPVHKVSLNNFYLGRTEVTQEQWRAVMGTNPSRFKGGDRPVENVSWNDVQAFIKKLNAKTGEKYRLPTEAEWEYAARGGQQSLGFECAGSNNQDEVAWYSHKHSEDKTHPAGQKKANELRLYDMSGNVCEWCQDWYGAYPSSASNNPQGPDTGSFRVLRGGSWYSGAGYCRVASRHNVDPDYVSSRYGFRVARTF